MKVVKTDFVEGAKKAKGVVVIIDVFRAFSTVCYCFDRGAERVIPVGEIEEAHALRRDYENVVLVGERGGKKLPGFDFGNSPSEIKLTDLTGKTVIQTTHAGTQGLVNAKGADELLTGSFVNAKATASYIRSKSPELVTLVRMGWKSVVSSDEDNLCADYLESLLLDDVFATNTIESTLRESPCSDRFFDPEKPWSPQGDFDLCVEHDVFNFVVAGQAGGQGELLLCPIQQKAADPLKSV